MIVAPEKNKIQVNGTSVLILPFTKSVKPTAILNIAHKTFTGGGDRPLPRWFGKRRRKFITGYAVNKVRYAVGQERPGKKKQAI